MAENGKETAPKADNDKGDAAPPKKGFMSRLMSGLGAAGRGTASAGKWMYARGKEALEPEAPAPFDPALFKNPELEAPPAFKLPELDKNSPDYEANKAIHDAYENWGKAHEEYMRGADAERRKYFDDLRAYVASKPQPRRFSPLSAFMIAMGGGPGAMENVAATNQAAMSAEDKQREELLSLKEQALRGALEDSMKTRQFRSALSQTVELEKLASMRQRIKDEQAQKIAQTRAQAVIGAAQARADAQQRRIDNDFQIVRYKERARAIVASGTRKMASLAVLRDVTGASVANLEQIDAISRELEDELDRLNAEEEAELRSGGGNPPAGGGGASGGTSGRPAAYPGAQSGASRSAVSENLRRIREARANAGRQGNN